MPARASLPAATLSPAEVFAGRRIFLIGGTGFLGKVTLSMLLHRFPGVERVYVMVRAPNVAESENRFWSSIVSAPPFDPLRERLGGAFEEFIRDKVRVVGGDIGDANLGLSEDDAGRVAADIDVILNSAGKVTFNPALDSALRTNVTGTRNLIAFARRMSRPALVHTSTCFVAGNRSGTIFEDEPVHGFFPKQDAMTGVAFDPEKEIRDCEALAARVREEANDHLTLARITQLARERLHQDGRDLDDPSALASAIQRERKTWMRTRLTDLGIERALFWGWPNIYTYTKSLAEQLLAAETGIVRTIVRPSIVESAEQYPFAGWNEGMTTTAPLILMSLNGHVQFPASGDLRLDVTPVDSVASVLLAVTAEACVGEPKLVYQAATSDVRPLPMRRVVELAGLHKRRKLHDRATGSRLVNAISGMMEATTVTPERYRRTSLPLFNAVSTKVSGFLDRVRPQLGDGRIGRVADMAKGEADRIAELTGEANAVVEMFHPFTVENKYVLSAAHVRELFARIPADERHLLRWAPETIDWYDYWLNVHLPGLETWVLPQLEEELAERPRRVYTYRDLVELFDAATKRNASRLAVRIERDGVVEKYTYGDLQEVATRAAGFLAVNGVAPGERVLLAAKNEPGWGISYFAVLKAGATCVPVDPESGTEELVRLLRAADAMAVVFSDELAERHAVLPALLRDAGAERVRIWRFSDLFAIEDEAVERERAAALPARIPGYTPASILFTSGTTGDPKGVILTHRNLTSMVSMLSSVFPLGPRDGVLSVLPLHHTFEFSAGFLMPLTHGAQITYLQEVNRDELLRAFRQSHVTAMVGVPAVWESLHRRITDRIAERGTWVESLATVLGILNTWVRDRTPLNLGPMLFAPVHNELGTRLRLLISGGAPLREEVKRDLHRLGFTLLEGYGLTEASPVLTVTRPQNRLEAKGVGVALPGVELRIADPDASGVGEVIARGGNIMSGYFRNDAATEATIVEGWLRTGDLGRLDEKGNLHLIGRSKEIIVDADGRNVYPDELEELYAGCAWVSELCVLGLTEGASEKVACVIVPAYAHDVSLPPAEVRRLAEAHIKEVSARLPHHKRIKLVHFTDDPLPRTATRKVKRRELAAMLREAERRAAAAPAPAERTPAGELAWLIDVVAAVAHRKRFDVGPATRLAALGFDSLMYVELAIAIEEAALVSMTTNELVLIDDVSQLAQHIRQAGAHPVSRAARTDVRERRGDEAEIRVPSIVRTAGSIGLDALQRVFYRAVLDASYEGREHVPAHTNFILAANHASHLDMGLAKMALGDQGRDLIAVAAADYFFDNKYKRAYVENFTNLVPLERSGSMRQSLRQVLDLLARGYNVLIFPEGTRTPTGQMIDFKPSVGYLALEARVGILPAFIEGTFDALPKGSALLKARKVGVRIGQFLPIEELERMTAGMPASAANRLVTAKLRHDVVALRDRSTTPFDLAGYRRRWDGAPPAEVDDEVAERELGPATSVGD
ncbi:MAG TPA: AMP-binding protein [Gemmatimonadaceae bacterium]|nr:AMP-binding protein [Gemmatimonadaceae bacterium]